MASTVFSCCHEMHVRHGLTCSLARRLRQPRPAAVIRMLRTLECADAGGACCQSNTNGCCWNPNLCDTDRSHMRSTLTTSHVKASTIFVVLYHCCNDLGLQGFRLQTFTPEQKLIQSSRITAKHNVNSQHARLTDPCSKLSILLGTQH